MRLTEIVMWLTKQCYLRVSSRPWFYPVMWITAFVATILVLKVARPPHHGPSCSQQKVQVECLPIGTQFHGIPQNVPYEGGPEGSCWCGHHDEYCLCTPSLSVDVIIEVVALDDERHSGGSSLRAGVDDDIDVAKLTLLLDKQVVSGELSTRDAKFIVDSVKFRLNGRGSSNSLRNKANGRGIVVTNRTQPPFGVALPGGFVDVGESAETAAVREVSPWCASQRNSLCDPRLHDNQQRRRRRLFPH